LPQSDRRPASDGRSPVSFSKFFVVGPSGVGKTELAVKLAQHCDAEIIGADAFQIYRGMDIVTAKPSAEMRRKVPHHLIDLVPIEQKFDVAEYLAAAEQAIESVSRRGKVPLIVGGTGLYVRALTHGLADLPAANAELREELEQRSLSELQQQLRSLDPEGASQIDLQNQRRVVRAIEICLLTGRPFSQRRSQWDRDPQYSGVLLVRQRDDLYARIDRRVEEMFAAGLLQEISRLPEPGPTARQAIGLAQAQACLRGEITEREAISRIQRATRRYAKRQLTWFRRDPMLGTVDLTAQSDPESLIRRLALSAALSDLRSSSNV
jgi:tRNA dimethylallyltransferase